METAGTQTYKNEFTSRWGADCEIIGNCGEHQPDYLNCPMTLLKIRFAGIDEESYRFTMSLSAEHGSKQVEYWAKQVPQIALSREELGRALEDAA